MSFRLNLSQREPSDRSFLMQGNSLVATSIGITANRTSLSCRMNIQDQDCHYYRSDMEICEALGMLDYKLKSHAFRQIQKFTHFHLEVTNSVFVPEALNNGNYDVLSKFLTQLRNNRVGAYVKLNLQETKGYFMKAATLLKPVTKIVRGKMKEGFTYLRKNLIIEREKDKKRMILQEFDKISSIENKDSVSSDLHHKKPKDNFIKISYTCIKANNEKLHEISNRRSSVTSRGQISTSRTSRQPEVISIKELLQDSLTKEYQFQNVNISRIYASKVKTSGNT